MKLPTLDLFSGIGGHARALRSGLRAIAYCDINPSARAVLQHNMDAGLIDRAPIFTDVVTLKGAQLPAKPSVITASFPCQDISTLGKGHGISGGARSGLFHEVVRLVDELPSVKAVYLENVGAIRNRGLDVVVAELARRGFRTAWGFFSAEEVGAHHLRRRWYCLAVKGGLRPPRVRATPYNFEALRSVPRLLKKLAPHSAESQALHRRLSLLGNSIVPDTCVLAWNTLVDVLRGAYASFARSEGSLKDTLFLARSPDDIQTFAKTSRPKLAKVDLVVDGVVWHAWPTPLQNPSHHHPSTHHKARREVNRMTTRVFHEDQTKARFGFAVVDDRTKAAWFINPEWVEVLMGYPKGWTRV